jgi:hypothetical protein
MVEQDGEVAVSLDSATIARIGLRTTALRAASSAPSLSLPALVIDDPGATTLLRAGVGGRLRVADGRSWPRLGESLQAGDTLAQVGDALPLLLPRGGTVTRVLAQPGEVVQPGQELLEVVDYSAPLVRVSWSAEAGAPPATLTLSPLGGGKSVRATLLGPAPAGDPLTLGPASLYRASGSPLRPAQALLAEVGGAGAFRRGVLIPTAAVVQWDGLAWAYVERAPGRYVRLMLPTDGAVEGGWLVERNFAAGDQVVTVAAGQLLAEEFRARITVGEEVGE